jgi:hypothetical protein
MAAVALLCAAIGAAAILLLGGKSKSDHRQTSLEAATAGSHAATSAADTSATTAPTTSQEPAPMAQAAVLTLLGRYQADYSAHDVAGLSSAFSSGVVRRGLTAKGCAVSKGRAAVLSAYGSQFAAGSGTYRLIGLTPRDVELRGSSEAYVNSHYQISPGGSGSVSFTLTREGQEWKIRKIYATCG